MRLCRLKKTTNFLREHVSPLLSHRAGFVKYSGRWDQEHLSANASNQSFLFVSQIHSVHRRREVQGRAKDFDVLVAELKASAKKGEPPKDKSPVRKEAASERLLQDPSLLSQTLLVLPNTSPCRVKQPYSHCALSRYRNWLSPQVKSRGKVDHMKLHASLIKGAS